MPFFKTFFFVANQMEVQMSLSTMLYCGKFPACKYVFD